MSIAVIYAKNKELQFCYSLKNSRQSVNLAFFFFACFDKSISSFAYLHIQLPEEKVVYSLLSKTRVVQGEDPNFFLCLLKVMIKY